VDPSGHILEKGTGGIGGFTSPIEEYLHWARVAARKAYEEGTEPEDAVRKYVPTQYQEEVLPTAIVTFNTAVGINHGDAPDLGLATPVAGVAAAGTIKNSAKSPMKITKVTIPTLKLKFDYDPKKIGKQIPKRGWTDDLIDNAINDPLKKVPTKDTRWLPGASGPLDDPATAYYSKKGGYVVRNDKTGQIPQISNRNDPNWIAPWDSN